MLDNYAQVLFSAIRHHRRNLLTGCLLATLPLSAMAQEVQGRVRDETGLPIAGAAATLRSGPRVVQEAPTDDSGTFRFSSLAAGRYELEVRAPGFRSSRAMLDVPGPSVLPEIRLRVASVHEGVVVTASRQEAETVSSVLPSAVVGQERLAQTMPLNLAQALSEIPGVTWTNAGAFRSRPIIRGLASNRILVLVDGERLNNGRTSTNDAGIETSLVDFSQIEQVEVVKGPGSVLYGSDAFGGVINVRTATPARLDGSYWNARLWADFDSASAGRRSSLDLAAGSSKFSLRGTGSLNDFGDYDSPLGPVFGSGVQDNSGTGEVRFYPTASQYAFFKFLYRGGYDFGLPTLDPNPVFFATFPFSKLRKFSGGYSADFASNALSNLQARVYQQSQSRDFLNLLTPPGFSLLSDTVTNVDSFGFDLQATSILRHRHVLTYGLSAYRDSNRDARIQVMNPGAPSEVVLSRAPSVPNSSLTGLGFFVQDEFQLGQRLRITAGGRYDRFRLEVFDTPDFSPAAFAAIQKERNDGAFSGNIGANLQLVKGWNLTGNVARAFREPNLFERFFFGRGSVGGFVVPNPDLDPETSLQYDAGTRLDFSRFRATLNYFHNTISNLIVTAPGSFNGQTVLSGQPVRQNVNIDESRIQGIEATLQGDVRASHSYFTPFVNLAWQRGTNLTNGQPLPLIAPFIANTGVRWQSHRWNTWSEFSSYLTKGSDRVPPGFSPLAGYATLAWRAGCQLTKESKLGAWLPDEVRSADLQFGIENLAGRNYRSLFETVPQPGRTVRVGLALNLGSTKK